MQITERSPKAEIITAACELADHQADRISELQQRQTILASLVALLALLQLVG
jgi:hypothetical protein